MQRQNTLLCVLLATSVITFRGVCSFADEPIISDPIPVTIKASKVAVKFQAIAMGFTMPLWLTHAGDGSGRLFIVDQTGQVRLVKGGKLAAKPVLDLSKANVKLKPNFDERGLLGIAFHPGYADKSSLGAGKVYTYTSEPYSKSATNEGPIKTKRLDHQSVIREWNLPAGEDVIKGMGREVMRFDQPQFNHDGGAIAFGPDGMLYIGTGDGGGAHDKAAGHTSPGGNGQDLSKLLGKILRIDPLGQKGKKVAGRHSIPADNPFVGKAGANDAIWAYGLRNPFRMSFDRESGKLIVGDVGQNFIEEVNVIERGGNYGWRIMEGTYYFSSKGGEEGRIRKGAPSGKQPKMLPPALQYDHDEGISVIGGFVYRGKAIPQLQGKYVFGEWTKAKKQNQGRVLVGDLKTGKIEELYAAGKRVGGFVTGMGEDEAGELYVLTSASKGPSGKSGKVHKIVAGN